MFLSRFSVFPNYHIHYHKGRTEKFKILLTVARTSRDKYYKTMAFHVSNGLCLQGIAVQDTVTIHFRLGAWNPEYINQVSGVQVDLHPLVQIPHKYFRYRVTQSSLYNQKLIRA